MIRNHPLLGKTKQRFVLPRKSPILKVWNKDISHSGADTFQFPHAETQKLLEGLSRVRNLEEWTIPSLKDKSFEAEIFRLKTTLIWWYNLPGDKYLDPLTIMMRNLCSGPAFAESLDEALKYSFRISEGLAFNCNFEEYPDSAMPCWGFDYFFSPNHLIPYRAPAGDDWKLVLNNPPEVSDSNLKKLKEVIRDHINEVPKLPQLDDLDRLALQTGTKMLDDKNNRVYNFAYRGPRGTPLETTKYFRYQRLFVYKTPAESRECFVPDEKTRNSLLLIKKQAALILDGVGDDIQNRDFSDLKEWLTGYGNSYYIMSDQKKCGLTFPLTLVKCFLEVLHELYPNEDLSHWDGYLNAQVTLDGKEWFKINNGTGLGMANELTSFLVSCVHELWKSEHYPEVKLQSRFYNDDQVIRYNHKDFVNSPVDFLDYMVTDWNEWMAVFGMTTHAKKPYVSRRGCYLEIYGDDYATKFCSKKVCQYIGCLFHALTCTNIVQSKEYVANVIDCIGDDYHFEAQQALDMIIPLIGYEFYQGEVELPFEMGGWFRQYEDDLNQALYFAGCIEGFKSACVPLLLENTSRGRVDPLSTKIVDPKKFDSILKLGWEQDPSLFNWVENARSAFGPLQVGCSPHYVARMYTRRYDARQKAWKAGPCKNPFKYITEYIEKDPQRFYKYRIPGELLVEDKNFAFLPICEKPPEWKKVWHVDRKRMWYTLLKRKGLSEVNVFDYWEDIKDETLLSYIFTIEPEIREFFDNGPVPLEVLFLNTLWEVPWELIKLKLKTSGFWRYPHKGRCVDSKALEALHQIIPGNGDSITWNMLTGEPVFVLETHLNLMYNRGSEFLVESNFKAIAKSLVPNLTDEGIEEGFAIFSEMVAKARSNTYAINVEIEEVIPTEVSEELTNFRAYISYMFEGIDRTRGLYSGDEDERLRAQIGLAEHESDGQDIFDQSDDEGGMFNELF
jgi:hypothetical protein